MQEYMIDACGAKRKAIRYNCKVCQKECLSRLTNRKGRTHKYCSSACSQKDKTINPAINKICAQCNKQFVRKKHKKNKSGLDFCCRKCKDTAQRIGGIKAIQPPHYKNGEHIYYRNRFDNDELYCRRCGYKEFLVSVQIHHIDKDRTNNDKSNLLPLCANCHASLHNEDWKLEDIKIT